VYLKTNENFCDKKYVLFIVMFQIIDSYPKKTSEMSEYCEYMWCDGPARGRNSLAHSIYEEGGRFDKRDKKLAIKTVRAILRQMPDVGKMELYQIKRATAAIIACCLYEDI